MRCKDCGSRRISWCIDDGWLDKEYDEAGNVINEDFVCNSLNGAVCAVCGGINLEYEVQE